MSKYGPATQKKMKKVMAEFKAHKLKSGRSNQIVTDRDQAIAIGLSKARQEGDAVPEKKAPKSKSQKPK